MHPTTVLEELPNDWLHAGQPDLTVGSLKLRSSPESILWDRDYELLMPFIFINYDTTDIQINVAKIMQQYKNITRNITRNSGAHISNWITNIYVTGNI